ncbi:MAG: hypothetical protein LBR95_03970 [Azoarcus sp.]|jgi:hypothetical protein|nr:hypothetical protein [Azoarcus sp.]
MIPAMKHKTKISRNLAGVFDLSPRSYRLDGFAADARNLRGDFAAVGRDLKKQLQREPADQRARQN